MVLLNNLLPRKIAMPSKTTLIAISPIHAFPINREPIINRLKLIVVSKNPKKSGSFSRVDFAFEDHRIL